MRMQHIDCLAHQERSIKLCYRNSKIATAFHEFLADSPPVGRQPAGNIVTTLSAIV
jgi:hypothetical protein